MFTHYKFIAYFITNSIISHLHGINSIYKFIYKIL